MNLVDGEPSFTDTKGNYNVVPPAFCKPGSTISYTDGATTMPAPDYANLTATSWQSLPQQTLTCYLEDITPGQGVGFTLYSKVRPEVPEGTVFDDIVITVNGDGIDKQSTAPLQHTVTAGSKWDLSFNGSHPIGDRDNTDFVKQNTEQQCTHNYGTGSGSLTGTATGNQGVLCYVGGFTVTLAQPNAGLGGTAIDGGNFDYTIDLSPETIWSGEINGTSVWQHVREHNAANPDNQIELPGGYTVCRRIPKPGNRRRPPTRGSARRRPVTPPPRRSPSRRRPCTWPSRLRPGPTRWCRARSSPTR